jgi:hypothetical protein
MHADAHELAEALVSTIGQWPSRRILHGDAVDALHRIGVSCEDAAGVIAHALHRGLLEVDGDELVVAG